MKSLVNLARFGSIAALTALLVAVPFGAGATVKKDGAWPSSDHEKKVSFEFDGKPSEGLQKLAHEAGWSLVLSKGVAEGEPDVHIDVAEQPADAVLEALFAQASVVAKRTGTLITIVRDETPGAAAPAAPAVPAPSAAPVAVDVPAAAAAPPVPTVRGEDRGIVGVLVIPKGEIVHDATVTGRAIVEGTVTGDLVVVGGGAVVKRGGRVVGNASVVGGGLTLEDGARIDGSVSVTGGSLDRAPGAFIGGAVEGTIGGHDDAKEEVAPHEEGAPPGGRLAEAAHAVGQRVGKLSLLFVLGCVLLALLGGRMDRLRGEIAVRPMRSFALGILGSFLALIAFVVLCVTIIGIPVAIMGLLVGILACYGAVAAILTTLGAALVGHRTQNVYLHLLVGCAILFVVGAIPVVGGIVSFVLAMMAIGVLVGTRMGGMLDKRPRPLV